MTDDFNSRNERMNNHEPTYLQRDSNPFATITIIAVSVSVGIVLAVALRACDKTPEPVVASQNCSACHNRQAQMTAYFRKAGSKSPEEMAHAVLSTRSPRLLASIAVVESGGNPDVRRSGYKRRHDGAYQVNSRHWGTVPKDAVGQALQAESILSELTETMPIKKALSYYGGDSTAKYQRRVLAELVRVP